MRRARGEENAQPAFAFDGLRRGECSTPKGFASGHPTSNAEESGVEGQLRKL